MRLLITGSKGQLAKEVIRAASGLGHEVIAPEEKDLDIRDFQAVLKAVGDIRPDVLVNCAAYNDVDGAEKNWHEAFLINGIGVRHLAHASKRADVLLVHFSTDYVFNGGSKTPYTIADSPNPIQLYGLSKLLGEQAVRDHGGRYFLIRTSWVFGEGLFSFPRKVLEWASKNKKLRIVDDQFSSPSYTADMADALMELLKTENCGLYHMTNSGQTSRYEWARFILDEAGWQGEISPAKTVEFPTPAKRPLFSVLDNFPLQDTIGHLLPTWQDATKRFLQKGVCDPKERGSVTP